MLRTRILTALVLLSILLPTLFLAGSGVFASVTALFCAAAVWEWTRLAAIPRAWPLLWAASWLGAAAALGLTAAAHAAALVLLPLAVLLWLWLLPLCLGRAALPAWLAHPLLLAALGWLLVLAAWLALLQARQHGAAFLLSVLALAWVADIAAYFGGRAIGGAKLAPRISPGKTWAGVWTAAVAMLAYAVISNLWPALESTVLARLAQRWGMAAALFLSLLLLALTVAGDLFESLLKRRAGFKDSSRLLPGHGGVLDRIDALLPLLPCVMLLLS